MMMIENQRSFSAPIQELTFDEIEEVNGGNPLLVAAAIVFVGYVAVEAVAGFIDGASGNANQSKQ